MEAEFEKDTGEVIENNKLYFPVRKDPYGKAYLKLFSKFPEDYIETEYGSIVIDIGAFKVKFISSNLPEEDIIKALDELAGKDVQINVRFKMLKVSQGLKEINLFSVAPEGKSGKTVKSSIIFPLSPSGFGDISGTVKSGEKETVLHLPEGNIVFDFPINVSGRATFSYGISLFALSVEGEESVDYNLLKMF